MNPNYLDFEQPIADLEAKIQDLRNASTGPAVNIDAEVHALQDKLRVRTAQIFRDLSPWQVSQLARHPARPYTLDYIRVFCDEFQELAGDRAFADDSRSLAAWADRWPRVVIIGHQKGRDTKSKIARNFGMPRPEGYRKALRLMKMAERFNLPLLTFIDTPGAYPGIDAEERGQSEAIARNLMEMAELKVPIICTVIGEGGSGGALAIGVGDRTLDARIRHLLGDHAGRLRLDPVEVRRQGQGCRRTARHHRQAPVGAGAGRQGRARAHRRRTPQPAADGHAPEGGAGQ